jgi:Oxidoreductase family, NAD-binding Rossmann fold
MIAPPPSGFTLIARLNHAYAFPIRLVGYAEDSTKIGPLLLRSTSGNSSRRLSHDLRLLTPRGARDALNTWGCGRLRPWVVEEHYAVPRSVGATAPPEHCLPLRKPKVNWYHRVVPGRRPQVRIGILGAARIAPLAIINPARENDEVVVHAVAARGVARARAFAAKHGIARVHELRIVGCGSRLGCCVHSLPNGLHGRWIRTALDAGKHVLCEKPFTANAAEAYEIAKLAAESDRVVMEASLSLPSVDAAR